MVGDFTGDGRTDLAIANAASNDVSVLLGNGDGTFEPQVTYPVGSKPFGLVAGDFNGDGRTDLATANSGSNNVSVLLNLGGTFVAPGSSVTTPQAAPVVADLTGDGVDDVFVVNGAGEILWRRGQPQEPGMFDPPITINPDHPSRDIVALDTNQGMVLASVDSTDDAVSLYAWRGGSFSLIGSLATGVLPAQIVAADLTGDGLDDLVVRNAGDGTLTVYFNSGNESGPATALPPPFLPPMTLTVGPGVSDVTLADVSGDGRTDIIITDELTGEVGVLRNVGLETLLPAVFYRAGGGLYTVTSAGGPATVTTLEATAGVASGALTPGGPTGLVAIDPGSYTFSVLSGLGGGRFANPVTFLTATPAIAVLVADLEGNGIPDTIVLSASGVTVYRGEGQGGFLPDPFTIGAGPEPTGMTLVDINGDGKLDLLIDNAYGDLLVLLGNGDGTFRPSRNADQYVALAVLPNGSATPDFIYADQGLDQVVVDYASGQTNVLVDRSSGLLVPGAVVLADLNGDGIPDLIVANSGGNDVLVYPGLGNGQFGRALNGGQGFAAGTDPVGITVANLNGRPDLVVADEGSNDVSILLNVTADGGFMFVTFVPGPRLVGGDGPAATVVTNVLGDPFPDLLISDSGSNQVRLLRGVGGGFFDDQDPTIFNVGTTPGPLFVGNFTDNPSELDLVTVNSGSNDLSLVPDINGGNTVVAEHPLRRRVPDCGRRGQLCRPRRHERRRRPAGGQQRRRPPVAVPERGGWARAVAVVRGARPAEPDGPGRDRGRRHFRRQRGRRGGDPGDPRPRRHVGDDRVAAWPGRTASGELAAAQPDVAGADRHLAERPRRAGGRARSPVHHGRKRCDSPGRRNHRDKPGCYAVRGGRGSGRIARDLDLGTLRGRGQRGRGTWRGRRGRAPQSARAEGGCRPPQRWRRAGRGRDPGEPGAAPARPRAPWRS